jgi:DNA (cytosine-5)-methyltransferase 1
MLGNAVPSLLAEVIANAIAEQLLGGTANDELRLLPQVRSGGGTLEPLLPVKRPYLALVADHEEHPGTGRGRRARLRAQEAA